jgi:tRNA(Ile)-lysidine synthase
MPPISILQKIYRLNRYFHILEKGQHVLLAVSGGADSTAMLLLFHELIRKKYDLKITVFHLNHGIRKRGAERDQRFVEALCSRLGIPCITKKTRISKSRGISLEERARSVRYSYLKKYAEKLRCRRIATAHTLDDQAETILMRLLKGCGEQGLQGIRAVRDSIIIRPLLLVDKKDIIGYLRKRDQNWCEDSSNRDRKFLRNRIRLNLIPYLKKSYNPSVNYALCRLAFNMQLSRGQQKDGNPGLPRIKTLKGNLYLDLAPIQKLSCPDLKSLLENLPPSFKAKNISQALVLSFRRFIREGKTGDEIKLRSGISVTREYGKIVIGPPRKAQAITGKMRFSVPGESKGKMSSIDLYIKSAVFPRNRWNEKFSQAGAMNIVLDFDKLDKNLYFRYMKPGDRFSPIGMTKKQKVGDFFTNLKVPRRKRSRIPLLISGRKIVWIAGYRISEEFKITENTKKVARIELKCLNGK